MQKNQNNIREGKAHLSKQKNQTNNSQRKILQA
jgi:hypothetical protein